MKVIDFHAHILPGIDDGSKSDDMSLAMLARAKAQGITTIVATPHFYADTMNVKDFLKDREAAYGRIQAMAQKLEIEIRLGAEVCYFRSLHESEYLEDLLIKGTRCVLLEMPFDQWTQREVTTVKGLLDNGVTPILAHIERFLSYQKDRRPLDEILQLDVICQYNSSPLLRWGKGKVLRHMKKRDKVLIGTDCHNINSRPINLKEARAVLADKLGEDKLNFIDSLAESILK